MPSTSGSAASRPGDFGQVERSAAYPPDDLESSRALVELKSLLAGRAWEQGRPVLLNEHNAWELEGGLTESQGRLVRDLVQDHPWSSLLFAPVAVGRELLGYVLLARQDDISPWTHEEQEAVMEVGRTLGRVVLNARLYGRERQLVGELQELDRYKGELIATISHELKTPLTSIIGHIELLEDLDTGIGSVEAISRNAERLNRLVQNLLNYSQIQEQRDSVRLPVDLRKLAEQSLELMAMQAEQGSVTMTLEMPDEPIMVTADPDELGKVIDNLTSNAVKYTLPGRPRRRAGRHRRAAGLRAVLRHRPRHLERRPGPPLLGLPPLEQPPGALDPGHRAGPGDLAAHRPAARRRDPGGLRARQGQHLPAPGAAAREGRPAPPEAGAGLRGRGARCATRSAAACDACDA